MKGVVDANDLWLVYKDSGEDFFWSSFGLEGKCDELNPIFVSTRPKLGKPPVRLGYSKIGLLCRGFI